MANLSQISIVDIKLMAGPLCVTHLVIQGFSFNSILHQSLERLFQVGLSHDSFVKFDHYFGLVGSIVLYQFSA
jgi:hypothetical protein